MTERLTAGDPAPEFTLPTDNGDTLTLKDLRGRKVLLYVYPAAMTPGCTQQACDFRDSLGSLQAAGYELVPVRDPNLCCGSAGTYSILEPELSMRLRDQKLAALGAHAPQVIATANIGCQLHLGTASGVPVVHWLQLLR